VTITSICYVNISLITDFDVGVAGGAPVSHEEVLAVFRANNDRLKSLLMSIIANTPSARTCDCGDALATARE
jgi:5'-methylthioadenosine phosphorylase